MGTIRETAEGIVRDSDFDSELLSNIEAALWAERERAAKIAEGSFQRAHTYASENAGDYYLFDDGQRDAIKRIASAIREGDG
jgi:hypothetical protein